MIDIDNCLFIILFKSSFDYLHKLCALLLSHGSSPFVKNQDGQTPFEVASQEDIRCLLRDAMIAENSAENFTVSGIVFQNY